MKYTKPEVTLFGTATAAIRGVGKTPQSNADLQTQGLPTAMHRFTVPAYEADE